MKIKTTILAALAAAAIVGTLFFWNATSSSSRAMVTAAPLPLLPPATPNVAVQTVAPQALTPETPLPEQVDKLMAAHDPAKAYLAYQLVSDCAKFNRDKDRLIFDTSELKGGKPDSIPGFRGMNEQEKSHDARLCAGLTERQRLSRLDYLAIAARAGVDGAVEDFAREGPFGDPSALRTRPDDPLVRAWIESAKAQLVAAADAGNAGAIAYVAGQSYSGSELFEKNRAVTYRYDIALGLVYKTMYGPEMSLAKLFAADSEQMAAMGNDLAPEERAAALAAAQKIGDGFRERRSRGTAAH